MRNLFILYVAEIFSIKVSTFSRLSKYVDNFTFLKYTLRQITFLEIQEDNGYVHQKSHKILQQRNYKLRQIET